MHRSIVLIDALIGSLLLAALLVLRAFRASSSPEVPSPKHSITGGYFSSFHFKKGKLGPAIVLSLVAVINPADSYYSYPASIIGYRTSYDKLRPSNA